MILFSPAAVLDIERLRQFLDTKNSPAAQRALQTIWAAFEQVEKFPNLGRPTQDPLIRQLVIRFGQSGYVARYTVKSGLRRHPDPAYLAWARGPASD